jgi:hypothetical protein
MRHAGPATLARIAPLLAELRARPALHESKPGVFYLKSRAFLHFHDDPAGVFADVRLAGEFVRMRVATLAEQADLLERIDGCLASVGSHEAGRKRERPRTRGARGR